METENNYIIRVRYKDNRPSRIIPRRNRTLGMMLFESVCKTVDDNLDSGIATVEFCYKDQVILTHTQAEKV